MVKSCGVFIALTIYATLVVQLCVGAREFHCFFEYITQLQNKAEQLALRDVNVSLCDAIIVASPYLSTNEQFDITFQNETLREEFIDSMRHLKRRKSALKLILVNPVMFNADNMMKIASGMDISKLAKKLARWFKGLGVLDAVASYINYPNVAPSVVDKLFKDLKNAFKSRKLNSWGMFEAFDDNIRPAFKYVDRIIVMPNRPNILNDTVLRHPYALHRRLEDNGFDIMFNTEFQLTYFLTMLNAPRNKLILALQIFAFKFELAEPNNGQLGAPLKNMKLDYATMSDVCDRAVQDWTFDYNDEQEVPYLYNNTEWYAFRTKNSLFKTIRLLKSLDLKGAVVGGIEVDDFMGTHCEEGQYPLVEYAREQVRSGKRSLFGPKMSLFEGRFLGSG